MQVEEIIDKARDTMTVKRVYGDPIEKDGVTVIPAATVRGGAGAGSGEDPEGGARGGGGGFGLVARPAGAYVIRGDQVTWQPALDLTRIIVGGQIVALAVILTVRAIAKARTKQTD
jgi:uncharacterized spore protein YtfJ